MERPDMLKNKLRKEEALPDELSWENMKDGIYNRMDAYAVKETRNRRRVLFFLLFATAISIVLFVGYHLTSDSKTDDSPVGQGVEIAIAKVEAFTIEKAKQHDLVKNDNSIIIPNVPVERKKTKTSFTKQNAELSKTFIAKQNNLVSEIVKDAYPKSEVVTASSKEVDELSIKQKEALVEQINEYVQIDPGHNHSSLQNGSEKIVETDRFKFSDLELLQLKNLNTPILLAAIMPIDINSYPHLNFNISNQDEDQQEEKKSTFITFGGGLNYGLSDFNLPSSASFTAFEESPGQGYSASIRLSKNINTYYVSSGLIWNKMFRKATGLFDNSYKVERNVLVEVNSNPLIGTREVFQDTLLNQSDLIRFTIHSDIESVALPLIFGVQKQFSIFYCQAGAGVNLSFFNKYTSKEIVRLNDQSDYELKTISGPNRVSFDLMGEFGVGLNIGTRLRLGSRLSYLVKMRNFALSNNIVSKPIVLNGEIVLGYKF